MAAKKKQTSKTTTKKSPAKKTVKPVTKKSPTKKSSPKAKPQTTSVDVMAMEAQVKASSSAPKQSFTMKRRHVISLLGIIVIIALLYVFRSQFVVATINGEPLTRAAYNTDLEQRAGKQSMDALVTKMLIEQQAAKQHVTVSDNDINDQIKQDEQILAKQGQTLPAYLESQGMTMDQFKDQTRINILVQKLLGNKIQVTDKEVNDELAKMQQENQQADSSGTPTPLPSKDQIKQQLQQDKINQEVPAWIANLQKSAKITYFIPQ